MLELENPQQKIRVVIVDDEPIARESISILLKRQSKFDVVSQHGSGKAAIEAILKEKPDLVFLDIQMPEMNGFQVLEELHPVFQPYVIFVTAFDQYAVSAFEKNALDYLLKPYDDERFYQSLKKAEDAILARKEKLQYGRLVDLLNIINSSAAENRALKPFPQKISIKYNGKIYLIDVEAIHFIESEGNFTRINLGSEIKLAGYNFKQLEEILDPEKFIRVHKSFIVNIDYVGALEPYFHGDYFIYLKSGQKIKMSRKYKDNLMKVIS